MRTDGWPSGVEVASAMAFGSFTSFAAASAIQASNSAIGSETAGTGEAAWSGLAAKSFGISYPPTHSHVVLQRPSLSGPFP